MTRRSCTTLLIFVLLATAWISATVPVNDDTIVDQVRIKLANDPLVKGGALAVDCKNGVVTLSGDVASQKIKTRAEKITLKVKGVKQVVNNLNVHGQ